MTSRFVAAALAALALAGCGQTVKRIPPANRPAGYHPELFPDIPLPPGFVLRLDTDQLAVVYAGGAVRRFEVSMIAQPKAQAADPPTVMEQYRAWLATRGWRESGADGPASRRWRKDAPSGVEELLIETGRSGGRTTLDFHLRSTTGR